MPHAHESSAWSNSTMTERAVLLVLGLATVAVAVACYVTGHPSMCFAVAGIAAVALIGFVFTALADDDAGVLLGDDATVDDGRTPQ